MEQKSVYSDHVKWYNLFFVMTEDSFPEDENTKQYNNYHRKEKQRIIRLYEKDDKPSRSSYDSERVSHGRSVPDSDNQN